MNAEQYQTQYGLTDAQMCRLLNDARPFAEDAPFFENRYRKMKSGESIAKEYELMVLQIATDDEADSYR